MPSDDTIADTLRRVHREAATLVDDAPDIRVRAAVLAAAARGIDARPRLATKPAIARPFGSHRWPLSAAALLVVSVMTGLVATHVMRESPERTTAVASSTPDTKAAEGEPIAKPGIVDPVAAPADRGRVSEAQRPSARKPAPAKHDVARIASATPTAADPQRPARTESSPSAFATGQPAAPTAPAPPRATDAAKSVADNATSTAADATPRGRSASEGLRRSAPAPDAEPRVARAGEPSTPDAWVERIAKLRADGDDVTADRELEALRRRYPDFTIPTKALNHADAR